jgi:hypothetical protein
METTRKEEGFRGLLMTLAFAVLTTHRIRKGIATLERKGRL